MRTHERWLVKFVTESNKIEGIDREPTIRELDVVANFLSLKRPSVEDLEYAAFVFTQGVGRLRINVGMDVRVGNHLCPPGGPMVTIRLGSLLGQMIENAPMPHRHHKEFEKLHPFMDGNGRVGRMLWAWQMNRMHPGSFAQWKQLGFLHTWYYQSLA